MTRNYLRFLAAFFLIAVVLNSCGGDNDPEESDTTIQLIEVESSNQNLIIGIDKFLDLSATAKNAANETISGVTFEWASSDTNIAEVDQRGQLTVISIGTVTISATSEDISGSIEIIIGEKPAGGSIAIVNVNVLTMESNAVLTDQTVIIEDGFITQIGPSDQITVPSSMETLSASGQYLMPGLADMHVHPVVKTDLIQYISSGVTTVLDMGNSRFFEGMKDWKSEVLKGETPGPNVYVSAMARGVSDFGSSNSIVTTSSSGRIFVQKNADYDFIKVYNGVPPAAFSGIVQEANNQDIAVIGHAVRAIGLQASFQAGQKMVAHVEEYFFQVFGSNPSPSLSLLEQAIQYTKDAGVYVTGNLSLQEVANIIWANPAGAEEIWERPGVEFLHDTYKLGGRVFNGGILQGWPDILETFTTQTGSFQSRYDFLRTLTKMFHDAGIPLLLGTDSPFFPGLPPGFSIHEDIRVLKEIGLSNYEILKIGTVNAGEFMIKNLKNAEPFGLVKPGYRADLILVSGNPLENFGSLRQPRTVIVRGKVYTRSELQLLMSQLAN